MADPTQYNFTWQEVAGALIKANGIHSGKWQAGFEIGILVGAFPTPSAQPALPPSDPNAKVAPGAMFVANNVVLTQAKPDTPPSLIVDAAKVNPAPKAKRR